MIVFTGRIDHAPESKLAPTSAEEEGVGGGAVTREGGRGERKCFFVLFLIFL